MKKTLVLLILVLSAVSIFAQAPQAFKYQAVIRDASDNLIANQAVTVRITIANSSPSDVYVETHNVTTSLFGLINLNIGEGTVTLGVFNTIDWAGDTYSVGVEVDAGSGYEDLGSSDLLSVPYALYALSSGGGGSSNWTVTGTDIYNNNSGVVGIGADVSGWYGKVEFNVVNSLNSITNDSVQLNNVVQNIMNPSATNGYATGLKFTAAGSAGYGGAAIIHERTGSWSQGKLHFATKSSTVNDSVIPIRMTIDEEGFVGIGTTDPTADLEIFQSTGTTTGSGGAKFNWAGDIWKIYHSGVYFSFAVNDVRVAYVHNTTGAWVTTSDRRFKENITPMTSILDNVLQLEPVSYDFIGRENSHTIGFIAQDVEPFFPEVVSNEEDGYYGISYGNMSIIAIKAIQEQQGIIEAQQTQINDLQNQIDELRQMIINK